MAGNKSHVVVLCPTPAGLKPASIEEMIIANALNVYNAGARLGLKRAGRLVGSRYAKGIRAGYGESGKMGNPYVHKTVGKTRSSKPGTPPAKQSGKLQRSVKFISSQLPVRGASPGSGKMGKLMKGFGATAIEVFSTLDYSKDLEFGYIGDSGRGVSPRPLWRHVATASSPTASVKKIGTDLVGNFTAGGEGYIGKTTRINFVRYERQTAKKLFASTPTRLVIRAERFRSPLHGPAAVLAQRGRA
tara:strand:- start:4780 stop:5514 length:735 start_codon:yes stop_codon:yes gene_type:complete